MRVLEGWTTVVVGVRFALALLLLPLMLVGAVLFEEARLVASAGALVSLAVLWHQFKALRRARSTHAPYDKDELSGKALHSFSGLWRLAIVVVAAQVIGALVFSSSFASISTPFRAWVGAAIFSLPGVILGLGWQRADGRRWAQTPAIVRTLWVLAGVVFFVVGTLTTVYLRLR
jgi:hypothetical protein